MSMKRPGMYTQVRAAKIPCLSLEFMNSMSKMPIVQCVNQPIVKVVVDDDVDSHKEAHEMNKRIDREINRSNKYYNKMTFVSDETDEDALEAVDYPESKRVDHDCPCCGDDMQILKAKKGGFFFACMDYDCPGTRCMNGEESTRKEFR